MSATRPARSRPELYGFCIRAAIIFTMVVFVLFPVLYFWTPEKSA